MNKFKKLLVILLPLLLIVPLMAGCQHKKAIKMNPSSWENIQKHKKVVIGIDDSFVPMGFRQKNGQLTGYDIDLAKAVFKQYGIKPDFQTIDWSMNMTELRNQTVDVIWNGLTITDQRKKAIDFSQPYLVNQQVIVAKKSSNIKNVSDLKGKVIGAQSGSSGAQDIDKYPKILKTKIRNQSPILYDSFNNAFIDLNANRIQGLLIDSVYANYYVNHMPNAKDYIVFPSGMPNEHYAVGIKKGNTKLQQKINLALDKLEKNGELDRINKKWFGNSQNRF